ncbi:hypothetical protein, unlikely [Trypanosoma congolense IL3000]|uniref:Uncharacterized protein n=1 Tax=Trypanosoma congolense (strain IL3000) TaxID=1068625 RepID=F9W999_TRYCI|nr:hypothetical protein, unlikely [Trypanosoma congolense IL3000]
MKEQGTTSWSSARRPRRKRFLPQRYQVRRPLAPHAATKQGTSRAAGWAPACVEVPVLLVSIHSTVPRPLGTLLLRLSALRAAYHSIFAHSSCTTLTGLGWVTLLCRLSRHPNILTLLVSFPLRRHHYQ